MALRELFDQVAQGVEEDANLIAARIVQLGGMAEGTAQAVARRTALDAYRLATAGGNGYIDALSTTLTPLCPPAPHPNAQARELKEAENPPLFPPVPPG